MSFSSLHHFVLSGGNAMTVYKGYMKIVKQNKALILLYLAIFFGVTMMFQSVAGSTMPTSYQAASVKVGIVDKDGGPLA